MKTKLFAVSRGTLLAVILYAFQLRAAPDVCRIEESSFRGWKTLKLANEFITLHVVPDIGGRVIQFQLGDHPFFYVNDELAGKIFPPEEHGGAKGGWKNYGGDKLWPAPQGWDNDEQWPGPGDPVLDGGKFSGEIVKRDANEVAVKVTSPPDARTGIQFSRTISIFPGTTRVHQDCAMRNISARTVSWSIWEVIQHDTADPTSPEKFNDNFVAYCPLNPNSVHPKKFAPIFGQVTHPSWRPDYERNLFSVKYDNRVGKVGLDSNAGWFAVANGKTGHCFAGKFSWVPGAPYPDNSSMEFWLNGAGEFIVNGAAYTNAANPKKTPYYMESEILSPLTELKPGEEYHFQIDWFATRCPKPIVEITSVAAVSKKFSAVTKDRKIHIDGTFGVFFKGRLEAVFKDAGGKIIGTEKLGETDPNETLQISSEFPLPAKTYRVTLNFLDTSGALRGVLGNVILPVE